MDRLPQSPGCHGGREFLERSTLHLSTHRLSHELAPAGFGLRVVHDEGALIDSNHSKIVGIAIELSGVNYATVVDRSPAGCNRLPSQDVIDHFISGAIHVVDRIGSGLTIDDDSHDHIR